jgi:hypothetical protein
LNPSKYFSGTILKSDIAKWAELLKKSVSGWYSKNPVAVQQFFKEMLSKCTPMKATEDISREPSNYDTLAFMNLLIDLDASEKLPAITFILNRQVCEFLVMGTLLELERLENDANSNTTMSRSEEKRLKKALSEIEKELERCKDTDIDAISNLEADQARIMALLAPPPIDPKYSFAGLKRNPKADFFLDRLLSRPEWTSDESKNILLRALYRGIGVHHSGLDKPYRDAVEALFRLGFLRVVVATGTLAAGINMPCRSTILFGDSNFLNPMEFKQMAGRSGRRGFDSVGNVVFMNISWDRMAYFVCSPLPSIQGVRAFGSSMVLRTASLLTYSPRNYLAEISSRLSILISNPLKKMDDESDPEDDNLIDFFLQSLFFLEQKLLVDSQFKPIIGSPCTLVERTFYHEPSNFILSALLQSGVLQDIATQAPTSEVGSLFILQVLAHLFNCQRVPKGFNLLYCNSNIFFTRLEV